jgi:hypothetical protein
MGMIKIVLIILLQFLTHIAIAVDWSHTVPPYVLEKSEIS